MTFEWNVYLGEATDCEARLYVQLGGVPSEEGPGEKELNLAATIGGPRCRFARTLPATIALRQLPGGPPVLAEATVPDPCFWSPELPFLYTVRAEMKRGSEVVAQLDRTIGLRRLGGWGQNLMLNGRRIVLRGGVVHEGGSLPDLTACREATTSLLVDWPDDACCREAADAGVLLIARLSAHGAAGQTASRDDIAAAIRRHAQCPAVVGVVVPPEIYDAEDVPPGGGRPLIGICLSGAECDPARIPAAAELVCLSSESLTELQIAVAAVTRGVAVPVMAVHRSNAAQPAAELRRAAERLQRSLIASGDLAGYFAG